MICRSIKFACYHLCSESNFLFNIITKFSIKKFIGSLAPQVLVDLVRKKEEGRRGGGGVGNSVAASLFLLEHSFIFNFIKNP